MGAVQWLGSSYFLYITRIPIVSLLNNTCIVCAMHMPKMIHLGWHSCVVASSVTSRQEGTGFVVCILWVFSR